MSTNRLVQRRIKCPECGGSGISYQDCRGETDHSNAHLCRTCSGAGYTRKQAARVSAVERTR